MQRFFKALFGVVFTLCLCFGAASCDLLGGSSVGGGYDCLHYGDPPGIGRVRAASGQKSPARQKNF